MSGEELYDEFGNLISDDGVKEEESVDRFYVQDGLNDTQSDGSVEEQRFEEDAHIPKEHGTLEIYGKGIEVLTEIDDTQGMDVPLVRVHPDRSKGSKAAVFTHLSKNLPKTLYDREYMLAMSKAPERIRNVAVVGPLNSGKTSLVDLLVLDSHRHLPHVTRNIDLGWKQLRYTDNAKLEIERGVTMKLNGITFLAADLTSKSTVINLLDAPGHVNFIDETAVSLAASDCAIICIDVVEGVTSIVENLIRQCQRNSMSLIFVLNKIDRLILELKLPPMDAYLKLTHVVDQINRFTKGCRFYPQLGNVLFASSKLGFTFTIKEFVNYYYKSTVANSEIDGFIQRLWGDIYYNAGSFSTGPADASNKNPTFVEFILLPLYKIVTHTLSNDRRGLQEVLRINFSVLLDAEHLKYDPLPLLKFVMKQVFRSQAGLIESLMAGHSPMSLAPKKLQHLLNDSFDNSGCTILAHALQTIDYGGSDWSLVRLYHGRMTPGMHITVIDSGNVSQNQTEDGLTAEDYSVIEVTKMALLGGRYVLPIHEATEGQIILLKGFSAAFGKSATLYAGTANAPQLFKPIDYINEPVFRIVIEPLSPKELPKLLDGLNRISKYYPGVIIKVEESGEHVILGFGELYLDSLLYDLRSNYAGIEIKISNPLTVFSESCSNESFAAIPVKSTNGSASISIGAEPMDFQLVEDLTKGKVSDSELEDPKKLSKILRSEYGWDSLAARNLLSFKNCNAMIDDTLPDETDKDLVNKYKQHIKQGFAWAIREGPLAEEPMYGIRFKLLEANGIENLDFGGQLIPMVRKACYIAMMTAHPILLEPIYEVDIVYHSVLLPIIEELLKRRRGGRIYKVSKVVGTPLSEVRGQIPVIESIGFETDLRLATSGKAMCQLHFWSKIWRKVPGDVMDKDAPIPKLKPAPINSLSRDFVMKTRRRKGLSNEGFMSNDGPSLKRYIEPELFEQLEENGLAQ